MTDIPPEAEPQEDPGVPIVIDPSMSGGCWANFAVIRHSLYEFTIDFVRLEFAGTDTPIDGTVVQRVNMAPLFVSQFIDALQENWDKYVDRAMPQEAKPPEQDTQ